METSPHILEVLEPVRGGVCFFAHGDGVIIVGGVVIVGDSLQVGSSDISGIETVVPKLGTSGKFRL